MSPVDSARCRWTPRSSCPTPRTPRPSASGSPPACARATCRALRAAGCGQDRPGARPGPRTRCRRARHVADVRDRPRAPAAARRRRRAAGARRRLPARHRGDVAAELDDLDLDTDLAGAVVAVEWGEGVAERLSARHLLVRLDRRPDDVRVAPCSGSGWLSVNPPSKTKPIR